MLNKENLLIYNNDFIPYIKFKMIPGRFDEAGDCRVGHYGYSPYATITQFECSNNINITSDEFLNEGNSFGFSYNIAYPGDTDVYPGFNFSYFSGLPVLQKYDFLTMEYENVYLSLPSRNDGHDFDTNNIMYHPMYKHCEKWMNYADTNTETDWITLYFLKSSEEYIYFDLTFSSIARSDNLKLYTTDSLDNIYTEDLSDTSKFEYLGDMDIETYSTDYYYFNPITIYTIPKNKILIAQTNNIFYTNSVSGCSYDQVSVYGSHKRIAFYNFTDVEPSATVYTSTGYSEQ